MSTPEPRRFCQPILSGLLLALLVFQCAGWFVAWHVARHEARWAMREVLFEPETPVRCVTMAVADLSRLRVGRHEIRFQGGLYDIRDQIAQSDSVRLTLYHDVREERLYEALGSLLRPDAAAASAPSSSPLRAWWAKWFEASYLLPKAPPPPLLLIKKAAKRFFSFLLPAAQTAPDCLVQPPEP